MRIRRQCEQGHTECLQTTKNTRIETNPQRYDGTVVGRRVDELAAVDVDREHGRHERTRDVTRILFGDKSVSLTHRINRATMISKHSDRASDGDEVLATIDVFGVT